MHRLFAFALLLPAAAHAVSGGPDGFGHVWKDSAEPGGPIFQWVPVSGGAVPVLAGGGGAAGSVTLATPWTFYGEEVTALRASRNGFLTTLLTDPGGDETNDCPLPATPSLGGGHRIYVLHDNVDLDPGGGAITYQRFGTSPHPYSTAGAHVFTWLGAHHPGSTKLFDFQALLFDTGEILLQFPKGNPENGAGSTTGIQNADATDGLEVYCNQGVLTTDVAVAIGVPRFVVLNSNDTGPGSLRQAVFEAAAQNAAIVVFDPTFFNQPRTIALLTGELLVTGGTQVIGPAAELTIDAGSASRVIRIEDEGGGVLLKDLHLTGGSTTTDGGGLFVPDLAIGVPSVRIEGCRLSHCSAGENGGGVAVEDGDLEMIGCEIAGCSATIDGGGLYFTGHDELLMDDCTVTGCSADGAGAGLYKHNGDGLVTSCRFENNIAASLGGAMMAFGSDLRLFDCLVLNNEAEQGAGLHGGHVANLEIAGCEFRGNRFGPGEPNPFSSTASAVSVISNTGYNASIYNSLVSGTEGHAFRFGHTGTAVLTNVTVTGNRSVTTPTGTGGIYASGTVTVRAQNCLVFGNSHRGSQYHPSASAGAFFSAFIGFQDSLVANCGGSGASWALHGVSVSDLGGNIDADPQFLVPIDPAIAPIDTGLFALAPSSHARDRGNNAADLDLTAAGTTLISDLPFDVIGNSRIENGTIDLGAHEGQGNPALLPPVPVAEIPALSLPNTLPHPGVLDLSQLFDPSATSFAFVSVDPPSPTVTVGPATGLVDITPAPGVVAAGVLVVSASNANGTTAIAIPLTLADVIRVAPDIDTGDALLGESWANATNLQRALTLAVDGTHIWLKEGVYYPDGPTGAGSDSHHSKFEIGAVMVLLGGFAGTETDPALRDPVANVTVLSGDITQNDATDADGILQSVSDRSGSFLNAIHLLEVEAPLRVEGLTFTAAYNSNTGPPPNGSAIVCSHFVPVDIEVYNCQFIGNQSSAGEGGAVYLTSGGEGRFENCVFRSNRASGDRGGAITFDSGSAPTHFAGCLFENNHAETSGGAVSASSGSGFSDCQFIDNDARFGAAVNSSNAACTFLSCLVMGNSAELYGAIHASNGSLELFSCELRDNTARREGGALYVSGGAECFIANCLLAGNSAWANTVNVEGGGALSCNGDTTVIDVLNTTFAGNFSRDLGGAIASEDAQLSLTNCLIANNFAEDATSAADHAVLISGSAPSCRGCLVEGSGGSASWDTAFGTDLGLNIDGDPRFIDPRDPDLFGVAEGDYRVVGWSPAIDAGDPAAPGLGDLLFDLDGEARVSTGTVDVGCYENPAPELPLDDSDNDGMVNRFEFDHTSMPRSITALLPNLDPDGDGLTNFAESVHGLHPGEPSLDPTQMWEDTRSLNPRTFVIETLRHTDATAAGVTTELHFSSSLTPSTFRDTRAVPVVRAHPTEPNFETVTFAVSRVTADRTFFKLTHVSD